MPLNLLFVVDSKDDAECHCANFPTYKFKTVELD